MTFNYKAKHTKERSIYSCNASVPAQYLPEFFRLFQVKMLADSNGSFAYHSPYQVYDRGFFDLFQVTLGGAKGVSIHIFLYDYKLFLELYKDCASCSIYDINCIDDFEYVN